MAFWKRIRRHGGPESAEPAGAGKSDEQRGEAADVEAGQVRIRPMREEDLPRVMEIERASFSMPWSQATFRGLLRRGDAALIVAEVGGEPVGHAIFWSVLTQGELGDIAVAREWRGRGIGTRLLEEIFQHARGHGVEELYLEVRISNGEAQRLYERHGFSAVGRRRGYYTRPTEDALVMRKRMTE